MSSLRLRQQARRSLVGWWLAVSLLLVAPVLVAPALAAGADGEHHEESLASFISRVINSTLLFGGIYLLVRKPLSEHLARRTEQVASDLSTARATRSSATAQLAEIETRLAQLPAELETLRQRGAEEIAAERARIADQAAQERARLLDQTEREVAQRLKTARRDLTKLAADLAVGVARSRLASQMTATDQTRLIDRYAAQMRTTHG